MTGFRFLLQVVSEAKDNFRKDDDVRWQPSGAKQPERSGDSPACFFSKRPGQIVKGNPQGERGGVHQFGVPPKGNANFAWVQHFIHHLAPQGMAGFVLANGSMSSNQSGDCNARSARRNWATNSQGLGSQRDIRQKLIEADLVDCMVALPGQFFYRTQIPVCLCFLAKSKHDGWKPSPTARRTPMTSADTNIFL